MSPLIEKPKKKVKGNSRHWLDAYEKTEDLLIMIEINLKKIIKDSLFSWEEIDQAIKSNILTKYN